MRKSLVILIVLITACNHFSYAIPDHDLNIVYRMSHRLAEERSSLNEDIMFLDTDGNRSYFYCDKFERNRDVVDSLLRCGYNGFEVREEIVRRNLHGSTMRMGVFKNYPEAGRITVTDKILDPFLYEEEMPRLAWVPEESDTIVAGYVCYKATAEYRGRTWIAYYTLDITVGDGPWKLCGLPGLILYARDTKGDFVFDCIGIRQGTVRPIALRKQKYTKCTAKEMQELRLLDFKDPDELMARLWGKRPIQTLDAQGRPVKTVSSTACLLEYLP